MDWMKLSKETPCYDAWQTRAIVTIKTSWLPAYVDVGKLLMLSEYKRLKQLNSSGWNKCSFEPNCEFMFNEEQVVFCSNRTRYVYPEKFIIAWMPWPEPYIDGPTYRCIDCGTLCKRTSSSQKRCESCQYIHRTIRRRELQREKRMKDKK